MKAAPVVSTGNYSAPPRGVSGEVNLQHFVVSRLMRQEVWNSSDVH
jgi:hypothetical protein